MKISPTLDNTKNQEPKKQEPKKEGKGPRPKKGIQEKKYKKSQITRIPGDCEVLVI